MTFHLLKTSIFWAGLCTLVVLTGCTSSAYRSLESSNRTASASTSSRPVVTQSRPQAAQSAPAVRSSASTPRPDQYRVRQGDTLYSIAFRYGLDYRRLAAANDIDRSFTIYPGQLLSLKEADMPASITASSGSRGGSASPGPSGRSASSQSVTNLASAPAPLASASPENSNNNQLSWVWPHDGKIVRTFNANVSDRKGVDLTGEIGDSVVAAAAGTVVYAGDGLPGYGNLIILEHSGSLLSAYAFNRDLLVSERDRVTRGQAIARMGRQGDQPSLHFEIRQEGKPVDPLRFLPQR